MKETNPWNKHSRKLSRHNRPLLTPKIPSEKLTRFMKISKKDFPKQSIPH